MLQVASFLSEDSKCCQNDLSNYERTLAVNNAGATPSYELKQET